MPGYGPDKVITDKALFTGWSADDGRGNMVWTVSYTHLDVYKRQVEIGETERAYVDSFVNFSQSFDYRHADRSLESNVAGLRAWYEQLDAELYAAVAALSEGAALLAGQPQLALTVGTLDGVIDCYQEVGGVRARVYSHAERPLEAGLVAIVDEVRINDPDNLFRCVTPAALSLEGAEEMVIEPCAAAFTLVNEDGTFYVVYAASTYTTCRDFCTALEDCAVHTAEELPLG